VLLAPITARSADILQEVPNDVLGFVVVHHLNAIDAKAKWLSLELRNNTFSPLAFLKTVTNIQDGLNLDGDFLLAVYPDSRGDKSRLRFGVWLPVADYARFGKSIGASSLDGISTVTVAGEDLLVARRGEWALVMDTDQRERMTQLVAASASPTFRPASASPSTSPPSSSFSPRGAATSPSHSQRCGPRSSSLERPSQLCTKNHWVRWLSVSWT